MLFAVCGKRGVSMIQGIVTAHDVLMHPALIVRCFGCRAFVRCIVALAVRRRTTFLDVVFGT